MGPDFFIAIFYGLLTKLFLNNENEITKALQVKDEFVRRIRDQLKKKKQKIAVVQNSKLPLSATSAVAMRRPKPRRMLRDPV